MQGICLFDMPMPLPTTHIHSRHYSFLDSSAPDHYSVILQHQKVTYYLSQGFYYCTNIMTKKQMGGVGRSAYISTLLFITKEVRPGTQAGQEVGAHAEAIEGYS
jgi:hypothetical protein